MGGFRQRDMFATRDARGIWARVGGCLELEFREDSRFCHARGQGPADIQCAARDKPPPCRNLRLEIEESCLKNPSNSVENSTKIVEN